MASEKFSAGRKEALQDIKSIIKSSRESIEKMDLSNFTGNGKALKKPEATSFFTDSSKNFFDIIEKDVDRLEKGESTQKIRNIEPYPVHENTNTAGKISAYRDVYNMIQSIASEEALPPVPENIGRWKWQRHKAAKVQNNIVSTARTLVLKSVATKGQAETLKYENECAEKRAREQLAALKQQKASGYTSAQPNNTSNRPEFNSQAAPPPASARLDFANIDMNYIQSFEEKNIQHPHDLDEESLAYFHGLHEAITVIENYKSSIKNKNFISAPVPATPPSIEEFRNKSRAGNNKNTPANSFCRTHSLEVITVAREAIVAMMKGAEPNKICNKISVNSAEKGFEKALNDISCIVNEINPDKIGINHSHGYRLTANPQQITRMAYSVTEQTAKEITSLMKVLANAGSAAKVLQTGIVETLTRGNDASRTQRRSINNTYDPS